MTFNAVLTQWMNTMSVSAILFQGLKQVQAEHLRPGSPQSGTQFENFMIKQLHQNLRQQGAAVFPPRHTLHEATFSGFAHQFDIVIRENMLVAVECKFREKAEIDQLFAFVGKLVDYRKQPNAIFLTSANTIGDQIFSYAIAHHISLVSSYLPPVEYMLQHVRRDTDLFRRLLDLQKRNQDQDEPKSVLMEWQNAYRRFVTEGYS